MKNILTLVALGFAIAASAPVFAQDVPTTQADCEKMDGMKWDEATGKCVKG